MFRNVTSNLLYYPYLLIRRKIIMLKTKINI
uniref:Uncharacterized protein n=1 Tax=Siphoviridae sp. ctxc31 TaxID=2826520 RepID=A0A8S5MMS2_9CAUD|nr:MAG TPA: hypothetical protein [Siphoviridae sp. ctxc31]